VTDRAAAGDKRLMVRLGFSQSEKSAVQPAPDLPSFHSVYEANFRFVWRCLRSLGVPAAQLDDVVQEVFVVAHRKLPQFDGRVQVRTWLYAIAVNLARRARRSQALEARRQAPLGEDGQSGRSAFEGKSSDFRDDVLRSERLQLARLALGALDDEKREVFVFCCIEGMPAPEVAQIIGIPVNTVYSRLRAARQAFFAQMQRLEGPSQSSSIVSETAGKQWRSVP
jgi:RNA polymerase sigma-70 factor, ECF subfamily